MLLGKATHDDIRLHGDAALAALGVELHRGVPATELHDRTVRLADGREFTGRHVIAATGRVGRA